MSSDTAIQIWHGFAAVFAAVLPIYLWCYFLMHYYNDIITRLWEAQECNPYSTICFSCIHIIDANAASMSSSVTQNEIEAHQDYLCILGWLRSPILEPQTLGSGGKRFCLGVAFCKSGLSSLSFHRSHLSTSLERCLVSKLTAAWWILWDHRGWSVARASQLAMLIWPFLK